MRNFTISLTILLSSSLMALQSCSNEENLTVNKLEQNEKENQKIRTKRRHRTIKRRRGRAKILCQGRLLSQM